jgi:hypothetical protein
MAVVNTKSAGVTNRDATPPVLNAAGVDSGFLRVSVATLAMAAADDNDSVYRFVRLPSNAIVHSIMRFNDAIAGATDINMGLHQTAANGGAAADDNVFADAVDINAGTVAGVEQRFTTANITSCGQRLWELLGLSADSNREYDLTFTAVAAASAAGDVTVRVLWST